MCINTCTSLTIAKLESDEFIHCIVNAHAQVIYAVDSRYLMIGTLQLVFSSVLG